VEKQMGSDKYKNIIAFAEGADESTILCA